MQAFRLHRSAVTDAGEMNARWLSQTLRLPRQPVNVFRPDYKSVDASTIDYFSTFASGK
jgi:hypothetical protein